MNFEHEANINKDVKEVIDHDIQEAHVNSISIPEVKQLKGVHNNEIQHHAEKINNKSKK